jgi:tetratricopeptide (TPR) repeat protein/tRNA A-37 threonylcarbamoyl transferase component Bud32
LSDRILRCDRCGTLTPLAFDNPPPPTPGLLEELPLDLPDGVLRGRYRLIGVLGRGAHGISLLARHEFLNHPCVVKLTPHRTERESETAARRLQAEARAGFSISHPNVVRVLDCDQAGGVWYFATEYVPGASLDRVLAVQTAMPWKQLLRIAMDSTAGLAAMHDAELVHRDIKPANLLLGVDGRTRVADLGVASAFRPEGDMAWHGPAGTPAYLAPEVLTPGTNAASPPADLYSWAASLFHLAAGRAPHESSGVIARLVDAQSRPVEWPERPLVDVPGWFVETLLQCLQAEPGRRPPSARSLLDRLEKHSEQRSDPARETSVARLEPGGVAVLAFQNAGAAAQDDWIGAALAQLVAANLSQTPEVYVADREQLLKAAGDAPADGHSPAALLEAGRLVGAASIVGGRFERDGDALTVSATLLKTDRPDPRVIAEQSGAASDLTKLAGALTDKVRDALGLSHAPADAANVRAVLSQEAQQSYFTAMKSFIAARYDEAAELARRALQLDPNFHEPLGFIGACSARLGRYDEAAAWHGKLEAIARARNDHRLLTDAWANQGLMFWFKGEYETARDYCTRAADLARDEGRITDLAQINNNLGFVLLRLNRLAEAEAAFRQAVETHQAYGALISLVAPYNGLGGVLLEQGRYEESADYYRRALALAQQIGDLAKIGVSHMNLGRVAALGRDFFTAKTEFAAAFHALERTGFWNGLARWYEYVADMNMQLANYREAILCAEKRVESARAHANRPMEAAAWRQKAEALALDGHTEQAEACRREAEKLTAEPPAG